MDGLSSVTVISWLEFQFWLNNRDRADYRNRSTISTQAQSSKERTRGGPQEVPVMGTLGVA